MQLNRMGSAEIDICIFRYLFCNTIKNYVCMYTKRYVPNVLCVLDLFITAKTGKLEIIQMSTRSRINKQNILIY